MDFYPDTSNPADLPSFSDAYGNFYNTYAKANNLPFAIGETGTSTNGGTASVAQREQWLKNIINPSDGFGSGFGNYVSATWYVSPISSLKSCFCFRRLVLLINHEIFIRFEYGPPVNSETFYIVYGQAESTVQETISNTAAGSS